MVGVQLGRIASAALLVSLLAVPLPGVGPSGLVVTASD